jgi:hypothetical protein
MKRVRPIFFYHRKNGYTIVEVMAGVFLAGVGAMVLSQLLSQTSLATKRNRIISTQVALESSLIAAIQEPDSLAIAQKQTLQTCMKNKTIECGRVGNEIPLLQFSFLGSIIAQYDQKIPAMQTLWYTDEGLPCLGGENDCDLSIQTAIRKVPGDLRLELAYRVSIAARHHVKFAIGPLGDLNNFLFTLPTHFFMNDEATNSCVDSAGNSGFARGINKVTGEIYCWRAPSAAQACPAGYVAKGFLAVANTSDEHGSLTPLCRPLRVASCGSSSFAGQPNYLVQSISVRYLDPDTIGTLAGLPRGKCVFKGLKTINTSNPFACPMGIDYYKMHAQGGPCDLAIPETIDTIYKDGP